MYTHNEIFVNADPDRCLAGAADVERWPDILSHYREVTFTRRDGDGAGRVLMRAFRNFGAIAYPIWWESEMVTDRALRTITYKHVRGITAGMDVEWRIKAESGGARVEIVHEWQGPDWPMIGGFAARRVIGPQFIHVVAGRTLEGVKRAIEGNGSQNG